MAQCALAAYHTVPEDFILHYLQTNFLRAASRDKELVYEVQRVSTSKITAVHLVTVEQGGRNVISATISFHETAVIRFRSSLNACGSSINRDGRRRNTIR